MIRRPLLAALLALAAFAAGSGRSSAADAARVEVTLDPQVVGLDELAQLRITVHSSGLQSSAFEPHFELDNLAVAGPPSKAESLSFFNGDVSRSTTLTWALRPLAVGRAGMRAISLGWRSTTLTVGDREIQVVEHAPERPRPPGSAGPGFDPFDPSADPFGWPFGRRGGSADRRIERPRVALRAEVTPERPYVGQQALYTLYLYSPVDISRVNLEKLPDFHGFWVQDIPAPDKPQTERAVLEGRPCYRVALLQRALFARSSGRLPLEPAQVGVIAQVPQGDIFGAGFPMSQALELTSDPVAIDVQPLPPPPADFSGAVGDLSLAARLDRTAVAVGEAATLKVTLSGSGHLLGLPAPEVAAPPGLEVLQPTDDASDKVAGTTVVGTRTWSYPLVALRPGQFELPPIALLYFDPSRNAYATVTAPPQALSARLETAAGGAPAAAEPHPIRSAALPSPGGSAWRGTLPWLFGLPWGVALVVVAARRRQSVGRGARPAGARRPAARRLCRELAAARRLERPRAAADAIEAAWAGFLATAWEMPAGNAPAEWAAAAAARGLGAGGQAGLARLAEDLHYLRYAPQLSSAASLRDEVIERSRALARHLA